jgi:hypothetical protein
MAMRERDRAAGRFALGFVLAAVLVGLMGEAYLRVFPPNDFRAYLGESSLLTGRYRADADFGIAYQDWQAFYAENVGRLSVYLPFPAESQERRLWAFFGNSFVQIPGMLADCARQAVPDRIIFNLGRNEILLTRLAQIKLLLQNGLRPERIFFILMPLDTAPVGEQPLASLYVTSRGALTYRPRWPQGMAGWWVRHSRLATAAWFRTHRQVGNPAFRRDRLYDGVDKTLRADLDQLFGNLARACRRYDVPVTIVLIPAYHQIACGASYAFQDTMIPIFRRHGLDVCDPRDAFLAYPRPEELFLPDKHFKPAGNRVLLAELVRHVRGQGPLAHASSGVRGP